MCQDRLRLSRSRLSRRDIVVSTLLIALVIAFFHNALIGGEQFYAGDTYRFFYPLKKMATESVRFGEAPVWNPRVHSGMPLHAGLQSAIFYPFSLLFYLFPFDFAFKWYIALHVMLAALATYFLVRRWRLGCLPAAVAGITYAFSGYVISLIDGLNIFSSIAWLPVVFAAFDSAVRRPRALSILLAALAVAAQTLAGDPVSGFYTFLICGAYWMVYICESALRRKPRIATVAAVFVLPAVAGLASLLCYVQLMPSQELTRYSTRAVAVTYAGATQYSLAPVRLLTLLVPYLFGNPIEDVHDWGRIFAPHFPLIRTLYVGVLPIVLIPIAIAAYKERRVRFFAGVGLVGLLLSLGKYTPLYDIAYDVLPMFSRFRYPTKAFFAVTFSMAVLGAYGLQYLVSENEDGEHRIRRCAAKFVGRFSRVLLIATLAWFLVAVCDRYAFDLTGGLLTRMSSAEAALTRRFIPYMKAEMLRASVVFAVFSVGLWMRNRGRVPRGAFVALAAFYMIIDLVFTSYRAMDTIPEWFYRPPRVDSVLRMNPGLFRLYRTPIDLEQRIGGLEIESPVDYYMWNREVLSPNFGTLFGYSYTDGYESANLLWHNMFIRFVEGAPPLVRPRLLGLVNVKYIFSSRAVNHPDLALTSAIGHNVFLYENTRCLDRAYFVPDGIIASSESVALNVLSSDVFDPHRAVVLVDRGGPGSIHPSPGADNFEVAMPEGFEFGMMDVSDLPDPAPEPVSQERPAHVEIVKYSPSAVVLSVHAPTDGYVVLCDAYYPKWLAHVNGKEVNVLRANCTVRAVPVTNGDNSIEFAYDSSSFRRAGWVSLVTLMVCIGIGSLDIALGLVRGGQGAARTGSEIEE